MKERLQKIISSAGAASRRAAEELIRAGRVSVNGLPASLGMSADPDTDEILLNGAPIRPSQSMVYIALNKPKGYLTAMTDGEGLGRKTVADLTADAPCRVYPVGRLDLNTEGLLLMTNDGEFANRVAHPSYEKEKVYHARVLGDVTAGAAALGQPMEIDGYRIRPAEVAVLSRFQGGGVVSVKIHEGRNRQVRKMCLQAGLRVASLRRVSVGPVQLGDIPSGKWRYLTDAEREELLSPNR
jgi:23S rRNA pseudouridine2605 synthase